MILKLANMLLFGMEQIPLGAYDGITIETKNQQWESDL
jgi:hypothetical protein